MKAVSWIFRRLTQNEFKAITDRIQSKGGGSQTYIDLPKSKISDSNLNDFFGAGKSLDNKGYNWEVPIYSLGLDLPAQKVVISSRRKVSNCIREQNKDKRINIWKEEFSNFPSGSYNDTSDPIYLFIVKTDEGKFYAGWFYANQYNETWYLTKDICQPMTNTDAGYCKFSVPIKMDDKIYSWPFIGLDSSDASQIEDDRIVKSSTSLSASSEISDDVLSIINAIRTKPFVLLAGISGTGKSRIVRQLAKSVWSLESAEHRAHKPSNFEMVQVKPNWHDSSELLGYVSRIGPEPEFISGDFLRFVVRAWCYPSIPHFLCLDEMNLAPVEQYFAEFLSVSESRKLQEDRKTVKTDALLSNPLTDKDPHSGAPTAPKWFENLIDNLLTAVKCPDGKYVALREQFLTDGISIPQNLIVIGTVNMDETTYSFSRKVLDRAMTIEMNEVDLYAGLDKSKNEVNFIPSDHLLADAVEGYDVYEDYKDVCNLVIGYLDKVNNILEKTPFKVAYRTRNEFLIYVVNALKLAHIEGVDANVVAKALDEVTSMKILSRIEGDKKKVHFLDALELTIRQELNNINEGFDSKVSLPKIETMRERLKSGYTSFWD